MNISFEMNEKESKAYDKFVTKSWKKKATDSTAIGGRFSVEFTPTSLGNIVIAIDNQRGKRRDITDYECW